MPQNIWNFKNIQSGKSCISRAEGDIVGANKKTRWEMATATQILWASNCRWFLHFPLPFWSKVSYQTLFNFQQNQACLSVNWLLLEQTNVARIFCTFVYKVCILSPCESISQAQYKMLSNVIKAFKAEWKGKPVFAVSVPKKKSSKVTRRMFWLQPPKADWR